MKYKVSLNGKDYEIEVERGEAILVDVQDTPVAVPVASAAPVSAAAQAPMANATPANGEVVEAPMAGVVLNISVSVGQEVQLGDTLCIIEAMKMENEISAPKAGKVIQIMAQKGANVDNGTPLVVLG